MRVLRWLGASGSVGPPVPPNEGHSGGHEPQGQWDPWLRAWPRGTSHSLHCPQRCHRPESWSNVLACRESATAGGVSGLLLARRASEAHFPGCVLHAPWRRHRLPQDVLSSGAGQLPSPGLSLWHCCPTAPAAPLPPAVFRSTGHRYESAAHTQHPRPCGQMSGKHHIS